MPYTDNDGVRIYWEEDGSGPPLLLIMGLGYSLDMWYRLRPKLAPRYRVIAFDNRGVGRSDVPEPPYTIPDMARDAATVLDAAGVERSHVIGASMGGVIAQELTLSHPDRVVSLVLGCTACGGPDAVAAAPEVLELLAARSGMTPEEGVRAMVPYIYDASTAPELIEQDIEMRMRRYPTAKGYLGQLHAVVGYETYDRLSQIDVPTLILHGTSDQLVPPGNAHDLARRIPHARLVMLEGASHLFFTEKEQEAADEILGFLAETQDALTDTGAPR